jgi:short-subunit dehydrogenase
LRRAIVIGASSGIGRALVLQLAREGWVVGATARRVDLLETLRGEIATAVHLRRMDVSAPEAAAAELDALIAEMGGAELIVLNAGAGHVNPELVWELEREAIDVNVRGFTALADAAMRHFLRAGSGHLVSISSITALRGNGAAPAYCASKAYVSTYMDALRHRVASLRAPIAITDIQPGFVDTAMAQGSHVFWAAAPAEAAKQISRAIRARRKRAVVTRRWVPVAWLLRWLPDALYHRLGREAAGRR